MLVLVTPPGATLPVEIQNDVIVGTDMSGVKTEMTGTMLSWMQDHSADGLIFIGPPGAAKSAVGKAAGTTAGIPTCDLTHNFAVLRPYLCRETESSGG